jgi:hypothetical protein
VTDQSLRDAVEELAADLDRQNVVMVAGRALRDLLAAHPAEPARPLLDREAVYALLRATRVTVNDEWRPTETSAGQIADAVLDLARPMPTREQIAEAMHNHWSQTHKWRQGCSEGTCIAIFLDRADAMLALLNGAGS